MKKQPGGLLGNKIAREKKIRKFSLTVIGIVLLMIGVTSVSLYNSGKTVNANTSTALAIGLGAAFYRNKDDQGGGGTVAEPTEAEKKLLQKIGEESRKAIDEYKKGDKEAKEAFEKKIADLETELNNKYKDLGIEKTNEAITTLAAELKAMKEEGVGKEKPKTWYQQIFKQFKDLDFTNKSKTRDFQQKIELKVAALMTIETHIVPANGYSVNVNNFIDQEIGEVPKPANFILGLVTVETQSGTEKIWWSERNTEEGDATFIGEGDLKPLISAKYETKSANIKEVAERWKFTNRFIMHTNRVVNDFREHANELMEQEIDTQVLSGDGTGDNLSGIADQASAFVAPAELANYYTDTNIWDVINAVLMQVILANFTPTAVVLNSVWKAKMAGIKDANGVYIVPPFVSPSGDTISGVRMVFSNKMPAGDILAGDLTKFKVVFSEQVRYDIGYENDDFSKNLVSNKLEAFLGTYIKAPHVPAIVYDDIATITAAISAP